MTYLFKTATAKKSPVVQLMGSGTIFREVLAAAEILRNDFDVDSDVWSILGVNQLHRDGVDAERHNLLHPDKKPRIPYLTSLMEGHGGPVVVSTDYLRSYPEQIRRLIPTRNVTILGTDGFGRSDSRAALRSFFEVDRNHIVIAALKGLADEGTIPAKQVGEAIKKLGIDADKPNPLYS